MYITCTRASSLHAQPSRVDVRRLVCQALLPPERTSLHIIKALQDPRRLADRDRLPACLPLMHSLHRPWSRARLLINNWISGGLAIGFEESLDLAIIFAETFSTLLYGVCLSADAHHE